MFQIDTDSRRVKSSLLTQHTDTTMDRVFHIDTNTSNVDTITSKDVEFAVTSFYYNHDMQIIPMLVFSMFHLCSDVGFVFCFCL